MATRQPDPLAEYLLLYRIVEAADSANGKTFLAANLPDLPAYDFGCLWVTEDAALDNEHPVNAFEIYRDRAICELARLATLGIADTADYLYGIRNCLAHGRIGPLSNRHPNRTTEAGQALPIIKLAARLAVQA